MLTYRTKRGTVKATQAQHDGVLMEDSKIKRTLLSGAKIAMPKFEADDWIIEFKDGLKMPMHPELFARFFELVPDEKA